MEPGEILGSLRPSARIAVIRLRSLGDTLLATPALANLKRWRPDFRVACLVEPQFAAVLSGNPDLEGIIAVPGGLRGRLAAVRRLRAFGADLTINLHGGNASAWLTFASGARWRASFRGTRHGWAHNLLTAPQAPPPGRCRLHTVEHVASLFERLGMPAQPLGPLRLFPSSEARSRMRRQLATRGLSGPFALINASAREPGMRWAPEKFASLIAWLHGEYGWRSVMARAMAADSGSPEEQIVAALDGLPAAPVLLRGTNVEELIAVTAECELLVGSDGGPVHIAAALARPIVVLYSTTDVDVWHPWQARFRMLQDGEMNIAVERVQAATHELLRS